MDSHYEIVFPSGRVKMTAGLENKRNKSELFLLGTHVMDDILQNLCSEQLLLFRVKFADFWKIFCFPANNSKKPFNKCFSRIASSVSSCHLLLAAYHITDLNKFRYLRHFILIQLPNDTPGQQLHRLNQDPASRPPSPTHPRTRPRPRSAHIKAALPHIRPVRLKIISFTAACFNRSGLTVTLSQSLSACRYVSKGTNALQAASLFAASAVTTELGLTCRNSSGHKDLQCLAAKGHQCNVTAALRDLPDKVTPGNVNVGRSRRCQSDLEYDTVK